MNIAVLYRKIGYYLAELAVAPLFFYSFLFACLKYEFILEEKT